MKVSELSEKLNLKLLTKEKYNNSEVTDCYCGDLLSRVMSHAKPGDVWVTIMSNVNITAVASLTNLSCVIIAENVNVPDDVIEKADENDVIIFKTEKTAYEICCLVGDFI